MLLFFGIDKSAGRRGTLRSRSGSLAVLFSKAEKEPISFRTIPMRGGKGEGGKARLARK